MAIYFINAVNPLAEKGGAEVSMQWVLSSLSQQAKEAKANRNTDLLSCSCPSHVTHHHSGSWDGKGEREGIFKIVFGWAIYVFQPGTFP